MYKAKSRIWFEGENGVFLGEGRIQLLKAIEELGSLNKACKQIGMSYKKAWFIIDDVNKQAKEKVVIKQIGGSGGGGTVLTDYGKKWIVAFENINQKCWAFLDEEINKIQDEL